MQRDITVAICQYSASAEIAENLAKISAQLESLATAVDYVVLPENALQMAAGETQRLALSENSSALQALCELAQRYQVDIVAGTVPVASGGLPFARCNLLRRSGEIAAYYDKIHLFDAAVGGDERYQESAHYAAGQHIQCLAEPWGGLGLAVCYDLRFPEQMRLMSAKGMDLLAVPAAFTFTTGRKHWELLLRARAVENQCYVVAANQCGTHADGRQTWGHSMIINPDGEILAAAQHQETIITATLSAEKLHQQRQLMPVLEHRKL